MKSPYIFFVLYSATHLKVNCTVHLLQKSLNTHRQTQSIIMVEKLAKLND